MAGMIGNKVVQMAGRKGTSLTGKIALAVKPDILNDFAKKCDKIALITGTNGKTTTNNLANHIFKGKDYDIVSNLNGSNMITGVTSSFIQNHRDHYNWGIFEVDEGSMPNVTKYLPSDYIIITNFFRDQLDRYGELSTTAKKIQNAIDKNKNIQLILNADDPLVVNFKPMGDKEPILYGFNKVEFANKNIDSKAPAEAITCPWCGRDLEYEKRFYAQQGHYFCKCGYKRPKCKYDADVIIYDTYSEINLSVKDKNYTFKIPLLGLYNAYNALAAIAVAFENGITEIQDALNSYHSEFGRSEVRELNGHKAIIQLIKNPTGASEVLKTIDKDSNILIIINDNYADGRDVSWLWDADFELLEGSSNSIITSGSRAYDMAVRLKYAGIKDIKVITSIDEAIKYVKTQTPKESNISILPTYTALLHINNKKKGV